MFVIVIDFLSTSAPLSIMVTPLRVPGSGDVHSRSSEMSKLAKGLMGAFVLVTYACAVGGDESPLSQAPVDSVELAIVAPAALPGGMGPRLQLLLGR